MGAFCARVGISRNTFKRLLRGQTTNKATQQAIASGLSLSREELISLAQNYYASNNN